MKPALLRPQALRDQQGEVRYHRKEGGTRVAVKGVKATNAALDQIELDPGIGSPTLGRRLGIPGLWTWRVAKFPLLWCYFERADHLDVVRLLGERRDIAAILGEEFAAHSVEVAIDVDLEQRRRAVCRPARRGRIGTIKSQLPQIEFINEDIDHANRAVLVDPVIESLREENALRSILAFDVSPHRSLPSV